MFYSTCHETPVGRVMLTSNGAGLTGLWLMGQKYFGATLSGTGVEKEDVPVFAAARRWLDRYFAGERPDFTGLPLAPAGGEFRRMVWRILCEIPYGEVITYGDVSRLVAAELGRKTMSAQAVGGAVGHNPISLMIPCHRVVGSDGALTGYAGGVAVKTELLKLEGVKLTPSGRADVICARTKK